jgi:hypothetical protein
MDGSDFQLSYSQTSALLLEAVIQYQVGEQQQLARSGYSTMP